MINNLKKQFTIAGVSGKKYTFNMYTFDDFDDLQSVFKSRGAIYIFTKRIWNGEKYEHTLIINNQESSGKSLSISKTLLLFAFAHQNKNELFTIEGGVVGLKDFVNEYLGINALLDLRNPFHV